MSITVKEFNEKLPNNEKQEIIDNIKLVGRVFGSEDGKKLLDLWFDNYVCISTNEATEAQLRVADAKRKFVLDLKKAVKLSKEMRIKN